MAIAGKVAITSGGEWSASVAYDKLVVVTYNNDLYLSKKANTGVTPTDTENWQLLIKNVTQEQYESILNGTTAVGNALKLNGKGASDFVANSDYSKYVRRVSVTNDLLTGSAFTNFSWTGSANGLTNAPESGWCTYLNLDMASSGGDISTLFARSANSGKLYYSLNKGASWKNLNDGGNADTVDGLHASDFASSKSFLAVNDWSCVESGQGTERYRMQLQNGTVTIYKSTDSGATWSVIGTLSSNVDLANYLPIDGSVPMSGNLKVANGYGGVTADSNLANLSAYDAPNNDNNSRKLVLFNNVYPTTSDATCLQIYKRVNGVLTTNTVLHTGNSAKVVQATSAPSDTTALWVDTANKVIKKYIDGAWTQVS